MDNALLGVLATLLLVAANGFFVAAEFAIVKVRASQIELKAQSGNKSAKRAQQLISHLDEYLSASQLGITLASLGLGWVGEPIVAKLLGGAIHFFGIAVSEEALHNVSLVVAFVLITFLHIVFGELAPKSLAIRRPEQTTLAIAYPLRFLYLILKIPIA